MARPGQRTSLFQVTVRVGPFRILGPMAAWPGPEDWVSLSGLARVHTQMHACMYTHTHTHTHTLRALPTLEGGWSASPRQGELRAGQSGRWEAPGWVSAGLAPFPSVSWRRAWQPTPVLLPGESNGQRSLVGYSPWARKESDMTEET